MRTFRVIDKLTGEEADVKQIAFNEDWARGLIWCDMEGFYVGEEGTLILVDECGEFAYCPPDRFEVLWEGVE